MRMIDCPCGHKLEVEDGETRARVGADGYDG